MIRCERAIERTKGLDVSLESASICVMNDEGKVARKQNCRANRKPLGCF